MDKIQELIDTIDAVIGWQNSDDGQRLRVLSNVLTKDNPDFEKRYLEELEKLKSEVL